MSWTISMQIAIGSATTASGVELPWKREISIPDSIKPKDTCFIVYDLYTYRIYGHASGRLYLNGDRTAEAASISVLTTYRIWDTTSSYRDVVSSFANWSVDGYISSMDVTQITIDNTSTLSTNNNYSSTDAVYNAISCSVYMGYANPAPQAARAYFDSQATKPLYIGVNGKAREVTDMYVGVNGRARKVTAIYVGVNGRAREVFKAT